MTKLQCEACGSGDVVRKGEFFVCNSCGMKYAPDDTNKEADIAELEGMLKGYSDVDDNIAERLINEVPAFSKCSKSELHDDNIIRIVKRKIDSKEKELSNFTTQMISKTVTKEAISMLIVHAFAIVFSIILFSFCADTKLAFNEFATIPFFVGVTLAILILMGEKYEMPSHVIIALALLVMPFELFTLPKNEVRGAVIFATVVAMFDMVFLCYKSIQLLKLRKIRNSGIVSDLPRNFDVLEKALIKKKNEIDTQKLPLFDDLKKAQALCDEARTRKEEIRKNSSFDSKEATPQMITKMIGLMRSGRADSIKEALNLIDEERRENERSLKEDEYRRSMLAKQDEMIRISKLTK